MKTFLAILAGIVAIVVVSIFSFGLRLGSMHIEGFFMEQQRNIEHEVFKASTAHVDSMKQELGKAMWEWEKSTPQQRVGLEAMLRHKYSAEDISKYPVDMQAFLNSIGVY